MTKPVISSKLRLGRHVKKTNAIIVKYFGLTKDFCIDVCRRRYRYR